MMSDKEMLKILENSPAGKKIMEKGVKKGRMQSRRELELQIKQLKAENRRLMAKKAG